MHLVKLFKKRVHFFRIQAKWVHFVGTLKLRSNTTYSKSEYIFKRFYYEPFKQCNFLSEIAQPYRLLRNMYGAEDRIRTYVGILPTVLQTVPFGHFGTSAWGMLLNTSITTLDLLLFEDFLQIPMVFVNQYGMITFRSVEKVFQTFTIRYLGMRLLRNIYIINFPSLLFQYSRSGYTF